MNNTKDVIDEFVLLCFKIISVVVECRKLGLRLKNGDGDYPFYMYQGFDDEFVKMESSIIHKDRWDNDNLACLCGQVLKGPDESLEDYFTEYGSFWRNSLKHEVLENKDSIPGYRGNCISQGLSSSALIPIEANDRDGLFHISDCESGLFDSVKIEKLEKVAKYLGLFLAKLDHIHVGNSQRECRIVIVDEYAISASMMREVLITWGYDCIAVNDPNEAYEYITNNRTDVMITEIILPSMGGLNFIEKVQEKLGAYAPRVIVLTTSPNEINQDDIKRLNIHDVLSKPLTDITRLYDSIELLFC